MARRRALPPTSARTGADNLKIRNLTCGAPATLSLPHARTFPEDFLAIARPPNAGRIAGLSDDRNPAVTRRERGFARRQDLLLVSCMAGRALFRLAIQPLFECTFPTLPLRRETPSHEFVGWFT